MYLFPPQTPSKLLIGKTRRETAIRMAYDNYALMSAEFPENEQLYADQRDRTIIRVVEFPWNVDVVVNLGDLVQLEALVLQIHAKAQCDHHYDQ
jgi:hypothetical protein